MAQSATHQHACFGAAFRLRRGKDFDRLFEKAESLAGRTMVLRALPSECDFSRCGVIASKRTFRRAVDRNRAKRLLREAFRLERSKLPFACDIVLVARKRILETSVPHVQEDFERLVCRAGALLREGR